MESKIFESDKCWMQYTHYNKSIMKNTTMRNMSSTVCASSMYSCLGMKMLSFLFVPAWAILHMLCLSCGIQFPVWVPGIISGFSCVLWCHIVWRKIIAGFYDIIQQDMWGYIIQINIYVGWKYIIQHFFAHWVLYG